MTNKPIKSILGLSICLALGISSDSYAKFNIQAQQPSMEAIAQADSNQLMLSVGIFDPLVESLEFSDKNIKTKESSRYSIVQFHAGKADSNWFRRQGIQVVSYLPNNAFIIVNPKSHNKALKSNNEIRWQGPYLSTYKVAPRLWQKNLKKELNYELIVSVFNDHSKNSLVSLLKKNLPNAEIELLNFSKNNEVRVSLSNKSFNQSLNKLAELDQVRYIDILEKQKFLNTEAVSAVQANSSSGGFPIDDLYTPINTPIFDRGLFGTGQIVGVADSGLDSNEDWFVHYDNGTTSTSAVTMAQDTTPPALGTLSPNNKVIGYFTQPRADAYDHTHLGYHGTHVVGSVAGDRLAAIGSGPAGSVSSPTNSGYDNDDGMAPNAQILFQDIGANEGTGLFAGYGPMFKQAYDAGVRIHSNSYGGDGDGGYYFSDFWTDEALHEHEDMLILFAAGNDGPGTNTIGSPANGKNVLSVGMHRHGNDGTPNGGSSRGPTDDGRIKPDIMSPGSSIESAAGNEVVTSAISPPLRSSKTGTSMATPVTAGSSALMRQFYTEGYYPTGVANPADAHIPTGPLMKATLINGAGIDKGHFNGNVGWGRTHLANSILFDDSDKQLRVWEVINESGLKTDETLEFKLAAKSDQDLSITLTWYDLSGPLGSSKTLVNDLDLSVSVNGQNYKGNVFSDTGVSTTGGSNDNLNTVEQVRIPTPVEGIYTITVSGANVPGNGSINSFRQGFALVATGHFDDLQAPAGELTAATELTSTALEDTGTQLNWNGGDNADFFEVYRVEGSCSTADFAQARYVGSSEGNSFTDIRSLNGKTYAYKVRAGQYGELGGLSESCTEITSQQACDFLPSFDESTIAIADNMGELCHTELTWSAATANCPASPNIKYNIYRSEDSDFIPSITNKIATVSSTSFDDIRAPDVPAYYVIRAEDNTPNGTGPNGGTETLGSARIRSLAVGSDLTFESVVEDVDTVSIMNLAYPWQVVSNNASSGTLSYKTGAADSDYPNDMCNFMTTNTLSIDGSTNPKISYKAQYDFETNWDGVVVEISTDDGATWSDFPPVGGYPSDLSATPAEPENGCGYRATQGAFSGSNNSFQEFSHDLTQFDGQDVKVRWAVASDTNTTAAGMYIDDISYPNVGIPSACTINTAPLLPEPGLYYDSGRSGHGFVIEPIAFPNVEDAYFTVFYTYKDDGTPEWYTSLAEMVDNVLVINLEDANLNGKLNRFDYDHEAGEGVGNPSVIDNTINGTLSIDFNTESILTNDACNDGVQRNGGEALATWQINDQQSQWCIEPLSNLTGLPPTNDMGGTWSAGSTDSGWGLSMSFAQSSGSGNITAIVTVYFYDEEGIARWVQGTAPGFTIGQELTLDMREFSGYGRMETPTTVTNVSAGSLTLTINANNADDNDGSMTMNLIYQAGDDSSSWTRTSVPVKIFTEAH